MKVKIPMMEEMEMNGTIGANILGTIILIALFLWAVTSSVFEMKAKEDKNYGWWDQDLMKEEQMVLKMALSLLVLVFACATQFVVIKKVWHPRKGLYNRYHLGMLAASTGLVANMLFVSFWFAMYFPYEIGKGKKDQGDQYEDERDVFASHQKVISGVSFLMAGFYSLISICVYQEAKTLPERSNVGSGDTEVVPAKAEAHMEILNEVWTLVSGCMLTLFSCLFLSAFFGGAANNKKELGSINLVLVLFWVLGVTCAIAYLGRKIVRTEKMGGALGGGSLGVGMLSGGTMYFALMLFMIFTMTANFEVGNKEARGVGVATSWACFFFSLIYFALSMATYKYKASIMYMMDLAAVEKEAGDFERMEDEEPGMQMAAVQMAGAQAGVV